MSRCTGAYVNLHFQLLTWLLEGPARTKNEMHQQFLVSRAKAAFYFREAETLRLIACTGNYRKCRDTVGGKGALEYAPLRILNPHNTEQQETKHEDLHA